MFIKNMTINDGILKTFLSNSLEDRWWEYYWIIRSVILTEDKCPFFLNEMKFYFLSYVQKRRIETH